VVPPLRDDDNERKRGLILRQRLEDMFEMVSHAASALVLWWTMGKG
jgi:hypothetical protein